MDAPTTLLPLPKRLDLKSIKSLLPIITINLADTHPHIIFLNIFFFLIAFTYFAFRHYRTMVDDDDAEEYKLHELSEWGTPGQIIDGEVTGPRDGGGGGGGGGYGGQPMESMGGGGYPAPPQEAYYQ